MGLTLSFVMAALFLLGSVMVQSFMPVPLVLALVLALQMAVSLLVSMAVPLVIGRFRFDPIVAAPSISMIVSNVFSIVILVSYHAFW